MTEIIGTAGRSGRRRRGQPIDYGEIGRQIAAETLSDLPQRHAAARRDDRKELLTAAVGEIVAVGLAAAQETGDVERTKLQRLGAAFPSLVLEGTLQQQLACKLATHLGVPRPVPIPKPVIEYLVEPLIKALLAVL